MNTTQMSSRLKDRDEQFHPVRPLGLPSVIELVQQDFGSFSARYSLFEACRIGYCREAVQAVFGGFYEDEAAAIDMILVAAHNTFRVGFGKGIAPHLVGLFVEFHLLFKRKSVPLFVKVFVVG